MGEWATQGSTLALIFMRVTENEDETTHSDVVITACLWRQQSWHLSLTEKGGGLLSMFDL